MIKAAIFRLGIQSSPLEPKALAQACLGFRGLGFRTLGFGFRLERFSAALRKLRCETILFQNEPPVPPSNGTETATFPETLNNRRFQLRV